jgi:archaemetzincin
MLWHEARAHEIPRRRRYQSIVVTRRRAMTRPTIALAPVGDAPPAEAEALVPAVASAFGREALVAGGLELPRWAHHPRRGQYLATGILDVLERARRAGWERLLGVADVDLFAVDLNFIFGEADPRAGVAVMSLARLRDEDAGLFRRRAETEAIHELGHTYGLGHCTDPACVMWFSDTLAETDRKGTRFCSVHARQLERAPGS